MTHVDRKFYADRLINARVKLLELKNPLTKREMYSRDMIRLDVRELKRILSEFKREKTL